MTQRETFRVINSPEEQKLKLKETGLSIQLASYEPTDTVFLAAHSDKRSILFARFPEDNVDLMWEILEGTKEERLAVTAEIRSKLPGQPQ